MGFHLELFPPSHSEAVPRSPCSVPGVLRGRNETSSISPFHRNTGGKLLVSILFITLGCSSLPRRSPFVKTVGLPAPTPMAAPVPCHSGAFTPSGPSGEGGDHQVEDQRQRYQSDDPPFHFFSPFVIRFPCVKQRLCQSPPCADKFLIFFTNTFGGNLVPLMKMDKKYPDSCL